jgi:uncharacterized protein
MVSDHDIQALADRIAAEFRPRRIVLFGSQAHGAPREDSDVDMLVVMPFEGSALRKTVAILDRVDPQFPIDLLLRTPEDAEWRYKNGDPIVRDAYDRGIVLYEAAA